MSSSKHLDPPPPPRAPSNAGTYAFWGVVLGLVLIVAVLEVALRIHNPFGFRVHGDQIVLPHNEVYRLKDIDPATGKLLNLGGKLDVEMVHTKNSLGFRGPEPLADPSKALTIVALGGSTTECMYLGDGQDWPARVSQDLHSTFKSIWIDNAGFDGQSSYGHIKLMQQYLITLHPRVVMMMAGMNEPFTDAPNRYDSQPVLTALGLLGRYSELVALGLNLYHRSEAVHVKDLGSMPRPINFLDPPVRTPSPTNVQHLLATEKNRLEGYHDRLDEFISIARHNGIEPVFITQPAVFGSGWDDETGVDLSTMGVDLFGPMAGQDAWALLDAYNDEMRHAAADNKVALVDLAHEMPKSSRYFYDFVHFSKDGAKKAAHIIASDLCPDLQSSYRPFVTGACPARR